jgi:hypothetical protein
MAKDRSGRPIPVYVPPPPDANPQIPAAQQQFMLAAQKVDDNVRHTHDLEARVSRLEIDAGDRFNEALLEFEQRFNDMMLAQMQEFEKRIEMLTSSPPTVPPLDPPAPAPSRASRR